MRELCKNDCLNVINMSGALYRNYMPIFLWQKIYQCILACNVIKKKSLSQAFPCEFCEISKNTFLTEHLQTTASDLTCILIASVCNEKGINFYLFFSDRITYAIH